MNNLKKLFLLLLLPLLLGPAFGFGQTHELTPEQKQDKLVSGKIWHPFVLQQAYHSFQKEDFDFAQKERPIFLYIGQKACVVCSYEWPIYAKMAEEHKDIDFVYLTPDDSETIVEKFGPKLNLPNLYVIPFPMSDLWDKGLAKVFPVTYFISKSGMVVDAATGGSTQDKSVTIQKWEQKLSFLNQQP